MAVENWNTNEALNNTLEGEDVSEGMLPGPLNNTIRKMAAAIRVFFNKTYRKNETVHITAVGGAAPASPVEDDLWIEYTP